MDIFKNKGRFAQGGTKHINKPTTHQERTHQHGAPFLFAYSPQGKKKTQQANKESKSKKKDKPRTTKAKPLKIGKEREKQGKKRKIKANTPQAFKPPNYSRVQSPTSHAKHATNTNPHEPHKTP